MTFSAIPTRYAGVNFRSRTEARWACFFDQLSVEWEFEPRGYEFSGTRYLPDFWLPKVLSRSKPGGVFFEVKGDYPTSEEVAKATGLACGSGKPVIIASLGPKPPQLECLTEIVSKGADAWDDDGVMFGIAVCGAVDIGYHAKSVNMCPCGCGEIRPFDPVLNEARSKFPNFCRWESQG